MRATTPAGVTVAATAAAAAALLHAPDRASAATLPLLSRRGAWLSDQPALAEAAPAIFVPGGPVGHKRLAREGIPAGQLEISASPALELRHGGVAWARSWSGAGPRRKI